MKGEGVRLSPHLKHALSLNKESYRVKVSHQGQGRVDQKRLRRDFIFVTQDRGVETRRLGKEKEEMRR